MTLLFIEEDEGLELLKERGTNIFSVRTPGGDPISLHFAAMEGDLIGLTQAQTQQVEKWIDHYLSEGG